MSRSERDCPHCGATFSAKRLACPECGSDEETGWSEDGLTGYSAVDIPDTWDDDAYLDAVADLPGGPGRTTRLSSKDRFWRAVGLIAVIGFIVVFVAPC